MRKSFIDRFWEYVPDQPGEDCWEWCGAVDRKGYGIAWNGNRKTRAHRLAYSLRRGDIPEGILVCHSCDNPPCCNPSHLFLGTPADNTNDMMKKGRERLPHPRKLTVDDVQYIRANPKGQVALAARYGVSQSHIWRVIHCKTGKRDI